MPDRIEVEPGYGGLSLGPRIEEALPCDFRVAEYPDGSKRIQGAYAWTEGWDAGVTWRDLPLVEVDEDGVGVFDD